MFNITRRNDPFREMMSLRNAMDQLFENAYISPFRSDLGEGLGMAMDVVENEDEYIVKASLPGIKPEDLDITYNNNVLTVKGEIKADEQRENERYHIRERRFGNFARSIALPTNIQADKISASYDDGILTLHLPKAEESKPRRIAIGNGETKAIDVESKNK